MYLTDLVLELSRPSNPYDLHRRLWQCFDLPPGSTRPFQFRVEEQRGGRARVLMQSSLPILKSVRGLRIQRQKEFEPRFLTGQPLRFRLKANPTKTIRDEFGRINGKGEIKSCRVPLIDEEQQFEWLRRKLDDAAEIGEVVIRSREHINFRKGKDAGKVVAVTFEGILLVSESNNLNMLLSNGIGPAKSLGCGMLSLAPG